MDVEESKEVNEYFSSDTELDMTKFKASNNDYRK
jgi:hypothetical protein